MKLLGFETQEGKSVNVVSLQPVGSAFALRLKDSDFSAFLTIVARSRSRIFPFIHIIHTFV